MAGGMRCHRMIDQAFDSIPRRGEGRRRSTAVLLAALLAVAATSGCRAWSERREASQKPAPAPRRTSTLPPPKAPPPPARREPPRRVPEGAPIRQVVCLFDQRPWLNLDSAGDRDPEGLQFRVFLDGGAGRGVHRDGILHIEMYGITRGEGGGMERQLVSDWHYATSELTPVRANILGDGYYLRLRWAAKNIAGIEVEIVARFESPDGTSVRSGTKRLRVPKYAS